MKTNEALRNLVAKECDHGKPWDHCNDIPNYPISLDACAEFEATLSTEHEGMYLDILDSFFEGKPYRLLRATPRQRCIAFLKTKGKL